MLVKVEAYHGRTEGPQGELWCARGIGEDIFSQGKTFEDLIGNVKEAVALHFEGTAPLPDVLILLEVKLSDAAPATG